MKKKHIVPLLLATAAINMLLAYMLKKTFDLHTLSLLPEAAIIKKYIHTHQIILWAMNRTNQFFWVWLIVFFAINGGFIYLIFRIIDSRRKNIAITAVIVAVFLLAELLLRLFGYRPGLHTLPFYFQVVDTLKVFEGSYTDSNGILKIDTVVRNTICKNIKERNSVWDYESQIDAYSIASDYIQLIEGKTNNKLSDYYHQLINKKLQELSDLEKAIIEYIHCPINENGFRSISFKHYNSNKPKILLLGDSFTWGHSTSQKTNSFADMLLSKGYVVYNTGISATDVAQYLAVAKKYIPILQPDYVIVNFFLGNDITYYRRDIVPYKPMLYPTNAGVLMACPNGKYFDSPQSAYEFTLKHFSVPANDNAVSYLMSKTAVTSILWKILYKLNIVNYGTTEITRYYQETEKRKYSYPYCNDELKQIKNIAETHGAKFILSSIPEVYRFTFRTKKDFPDLFEGLEYHEIEVSKSDYVLSDGHFNDRGHKKYAAFLDSLIRSH